MIKKIIKSILNWRAKYYVKRRATLVGKNQLFYHTVRISLRDGATKDNIILEEGCWPLGHISVEGKGVVIMHPYSKIDGTTDILCVNMVEIGPYSRIAHNTTICDNNNHPVSPGFRKKMALTPMNHHSRLWTHSDSAPIIIGENCWIGTNVRICKGVTIGNNSIVAACSVVTKDVPANCIVAGNPAKVVKTDIDRLPCPPFPED